MKKILLTTLLILTAQLSIAQTQNALNFDGVNDFVQTTLPSITGTADRTFEAVIFVSATAPNNNLCILDYGSGATGSRNTFMVNTSDGLSFFSGGTNGNLSSTTSAVPTAQWVHVAFVLNNGIGFLYVDGVQVGTGNLSGVNTPAAVNSVRIGRRVPGGNLYFAGAIDEIRIWNRALSATELSANVSSEICPDASGLVAYYQFNQGVAGGTNTSITTLLNSSGSNTGTLTNFALSGVDSNWVAGSTGLTSVMDTTVTESNGMLTAQQSGATYQWIDCSNNSPISGANAMSYNAQVLGDYAVEITFNGCTLTSDCVTVTTLSEESLILNDISLSQNPSQLLTFEGSIDDDAVITIHALSGKELISSSLNEAQRLSSVIANGLYLVKLSQNGASKNFKWIKE